MGCRKLIWPNERIEEVRGGQPVPRFVPQPDRPPLRIWTPPYSAITFNTSSTNGGTGQATGTITITKPLSLLPQDVLVISWCLNQGTTAGTLATPAGWTLIGSSIASTKVRIYQYWALQSVSTLGFVYTAGTGTSSDFSWVCAAFTGVNNTTPIDSTGTGSSNTASASITTLTYSTVHANALPLISFGDWNGGTVTAPSYNVLSSNIVNTADTLLYSTTPVASPGTVAAVVINSGGAASGQINCYQQFALNPAAGALDEDEGVRYASYTQW